MINLLDQLFSKFSPPVKDLFVFLTILFILAILWWTVGGARDRFAEEIVNPKLEQTSPTK
jgi:hypothetical protein